MKLFAEPVDPEEGLRSVRQRPGMYIGSTDERGLFVMLREPLENAVREARAGRATSITIRLLPAGWVVVEDDGPGIPVHATPETGRSFLEQVMTGFQQKSDSYPNAPGSYGVGIFVVNILSDQTVVEVKRDGKRWRQQYTRGRATSELVVVGEADVTGTTVSYQADAEIFPGAELNLDRVRTRLRELSFLVPTCRFTLEDHRGAAPHIEAWSHPGGLVDFVMQLCDSETSILPTPLRLRGEAQDETGKYRIGVDVALQFCASENMTLVGFINWIYCKHGGLHVSGVAKGVGSALGLDEVTETPSGLVAAVEVIYDYPIFSGSTKDRLAGPAFIESAVATLVRDELSRYFEANPQIGERVKRFQTSR